MSLPMQLDGMIIAKLTSRAVSLKVMRSLFELGWTLSLMLYLVRISLTIVQRRHIRS